MKFRQALWIFISFMAGMAVAIAVPRIVDAGAKRWFFPDQYQEIARITSPDGAVDAVMEEWAPCGAPCSSVFSVSIVPRGGAALRGPVQQVFTADDMVNAQIRWQEPYLLIISYDKAFINNFRNIVYPFGKAGNVDSWQYVAEIRLAPSSTRFSYLKP
jgi:hypothetical protein